MPQKRVHSRPHPLPHPKESSVVDDNLNDREIAPNRIANPIDTGVISSN
jgi:hypothetical protein